MTNPIDPDQPWFPCVPLAPGDIDRASIRYVNEVELACTPAVLFQVLEDADAWPKWAPGIGRVVWTSERPFGVGTTRTVHFWGGMRVYEDFLVWEEGRELVFTFVGTTQLVWKSFAERYRVTDLGGGRCRLTWTVAYEPAGTFARIHGLIRPIMAMNFKSYMGRLARYVQRLPQA